MIQCVSAIINWTEWPHEAGNYYVGVGDPGLPYSGAAPDCGSSGTSLLDPSAIDTSLDDFKNILDGYGISFYVDGTNDGTSET